MPYTTKQFQILTDIGLVWRLLTDVYTPLWDNGPAAPFFEYALNSSWMNKTYLPMIRLWLDGDVPVALAFYEEPVNQSRFALRPGHEALADGMIAYAESAFPDFGAPRELVLYSGQRALIDAAEVRGYRLADEETTLLFDFSKGKLDHPLPAGYRFVDGRDADPLKAAKCLWDGFNRAERGPFVDWDKPTNDAWSPHTLYQSVLGSTLSPPPHATYERDVIIADENGDYVCFSGMWWVPENHLAYMEPLCTVPEHQHRGLAAAALSQHDRNLRPLGARIMTGGGNPFYRKIGYTEALRSLRYVKQS